MEVKTESIVCDRQGMRIEVCTVQLLKLEINSVSNTVPVHTLQ